MTFLGIVLIIFLIILLIVGKVLKLNFGSTTVSSKNLSQKPPGPYPWPILGNLMLLGKFDVPFKGFSSLAKIYGDIYSLKLGSSKCVVVNSLESIKEVLNENGKFFGARPDFLRFHQIVGGDRNNSLALCDWSVLQQKRRNLSRKHCSPPMRSDFFAKMNSAGCDEICELLSRMRAAVQPEGKEIHLKSMIMETCANMFSLYMCSIRFEYDDDEFKLMVRSFEELFWEINQGCAVDFLPWLLPIFKGHMKKIEVWGKTIRRIILERYFKDYGNADDEEPEDCLLKTLIKTDSISKNTIIYLLEDLIGGHSAVGSLVYLALGYIAKHPKVKSEIQKEVDLFTNQTKKDISLHDIDNLPYSVALINEVLRHSSSPIVPHVATKNVKICGFDVEEGTIVFINNYELNTSERYWKNPDEFNPERFLEKVSAKKIDKNSQNDASEFIRVKKNIPHFLPFSIGKRTCIGKNLVKNFTFLLLTKIVQNFDISSDTPENIKMYPASVALPAKTYSLKIKTRN